MGSNDGPDVTIRARFPNIQALHRDVFEFCTHHNRHLRIRLGDHPTDLIDIQFDTYLKFSRTNESWGYNIVGELRKRLGLQVSDPINWFYELYSSPLLDIIAEQYNSFIKPHHFILFSADDIIDVVSLDQPKLYASNAENGRSTELSE